MKKIAAIRKETRMSAPTKVMLAFPENGYSRHLLERKLVLKHRGQSKKRLEWALARRKSEFALDL